MALFNFGKKKEEAPNESMKQVNVKQDTSQKNGTSSVKVLGGGCAKCNQLEKAAVEALADLGMDTNIEHVTEFPVIASYGVMSTPALVVDGEVVSVGKVLKKEEVVTILEKKRNGNQSKPVLKCEGKPKVAFVCNHNSCRSQMAEALGKILASDVFDSYSAGTIIKNQINQDAVRIMKEVHGVDMEETQFNKTIDDIPQPDVVIFMGCNVSCPLLTFQYSENWGLDDPSGLSDEVFKDTIDTIYDKVLELKEKLS